MKDIVKRELAIGDTVAFNPPHFKGLTIGKVVKFTPKKVTVEFTSWDKSTNRVSVYPFDLVLIKE